MLTSHSTRTWGGRCTGCSTGCGSPVPRRRVLAQADAWGAGGSLRLWLTDLPEGSYAGVHTVVAEIRRSRRTS